MVRKTRPRRKGEENGDQRKNLNEEQEALKKVYNEDGKSKAVVKAEKHKGIGIGKIIFGFVLVICAMLTLPYINQFKAVQESNIENCSGFGGSLNKLDPDNAAICETAPSTLGILQTGLVVAYLIILVGIILIVAGLLRK